MWFEKTTIRPPSSVCNCLRFVLVGRLARLFWLLSQYSIKSQLGRYTLFARLTKILPMFRTFNR